jgi:hypothetical protein
MPFYRAFEGYRNQSRQIDSPGEANDFTMSSSGIQYPAIDWGQVVLSIHKLLPLAVLYFFFNGAGLPTALFYTTMLSPLFFLWLYREGKRWLTLKFLICLSPFIVAHILLGIESPFYFARSTLLLWTVFITVYAFCWALLKCKRLERLFEQLIVLNFCAAIAAVVLLPTPVSKLLWDTLAAVNGSNSTWRLQLLTSEPSVYAFLMAPLLIFAVLRVFRNPGRRNFIYAFMVAFPMLLSQSLGGLSTCAAALGVALLPAYGRLLRQWKYLFILALIATLIVGLLIIPNPISARVYQVAMGEDSSAHSRTDNGFVFAYAIAVSKSLWWGVGLGQAKLYTASEVGISGIGFNAGVIPNSIADALAQLGIIAVLVKFILEFYLFFRTRVYANTFGLAMFVAAFLLQLQGSNMMDVQENLMWCFAFAPFFRELNLRKGVPSKGYFSASRTAASLDQIKQAPL